MKDYVGIRKVCILFFLITSVISAGIIKVNGQTVVSGIVKDAQTLTPLPYASVYFKGSKGVVTGEDGKFRLSTTNMKSNIIEFSYGGYKTVAKSVIPGKAQEINVHLEPESLAEVVVTTNKRAKYRNKNNPAVELIRKVIENKNKNRISSYDYVQYQQYGKMELSLTKRPEKLLNSKLFKNYKFLLENVDTSIIQGKALLPVYLEESLEDKYFRKNPSKEKTYILAHKKVDFGDFVDNQGVTRYLNSMYTDIDIYENDLTILSNQFLSPIADLAPSFYRFYIRDTVEQEGIKLVKLYFSPRNLSGLLFRGTMFITLDGNYAVQKINMNIGKDANLNWARELRINQQFERGADGRYHLVMSNMLAEFALSKNAANGIVGERTVSFKNYQVNTPPPDSVFQGKPEVIVNNPAASTDSFWIANRYEPLSLTESKVYKNIDSLKNMRSYKRLMDWATVLLAGYKRIGPNFEMGPVSAFYSFNPVEGFRLRAGGRTTPNFNKNVYFENYLAYGFKDQKLKYYLAGTYSFNHKSIYSYPLNYLKLSYQYETQIPGQDLQFVQEDNFLLSFKRGNNNKWLYTNIFNAEYTREFGKNISYTFGLKNLKQTPAGDIVYEKSGSSQDDSIIPNLTTTELSAELRWAPNEQFYQGKSFRIPIFNKYPIFTLKYISGIKGLLNGQYNYQNINLNIFKRAYFSQFGYADITLEGGYIFGKLPYPLLTIHRANQTYAYQLNSYNLMNFMEFVSDRYAAVNMDYYFNGFIFNRIPLFKKLKLKELAGVKVLYGGLRDENNPSVNSNIIKFPVDEDGQPQTFALGQKPYVEASVGIGNIFKLIQIEYVRRFTYLHNPDVPEWGIRARFKFEF